IDAYGGQISSRGILLDIPALLGVEFIEPEQPVTRAMLEQAEQRADVKVMSGDIVLVRTGRRVRYAQKGPGSELPDGKSLLAGFYADVLPWLRERDVAVLGSDGA